MRSASMRRASRISCLCAAAFAAVAAALGFASMPAPAQSPAAPDAQAAPDTPASCPGLVASSAPPPIPVALRLAALGADQVRITYAGHATFLIESPQLVRIATDYNDYVRPPLTPDIVTMNHAHSTHFPSHPDPSIKLVLRGWRGDGPPPPPQPPSKQGRARAQHQHQHRRWKRRPRAVRHPDLHLRDGQSV